MHLVEVPPGIMEAQEWGEWGVVRIAVKIIEAVIPLRLTGKHGTTGSPDYSQ